MRQLRAVDLFCGAGGFAHGMQSAGIKIIRSLDHDPAMIDIHRANIRNVERSPLVIRPPKTELDEGDNAESHRGGIHKSYKRHHVADLQTVLEIAPELAMEKPDIVFGGPPCQPFANIGNRKGDTSPLSLLTEAFAIFVATARPTYFVMENVKGIRKSEAYARAATIFRRAGYGLTEDVHNASFFGTPQARERFIVAGCLEETDGWLRAYVNQYKFRQPMSVSDALGADFGTRFEDFALDPNCPDVMPQERAASISHRLRERDLQRLEQRDADTRFYYFPPGGASSENFRRTDKPCPTIIRTSSDRLPPTYRPLAGDPVDLRKLASPTFRQLSRLAGYPADWDWQLPDADQIEEEDLRSVGVKRQQMLANSVPPPLANVIGRSILDHAVRKVPKDPVEAKAVADMTWNPRGREFNRYKRWLTAAKGLDGKTLSQELSDLRAAKKFVHIRKLDSAAEEVKAFELLPAITANSMSAVRKSQLRRALATLAEFELYQEYVRAEIFPDNDAMYALGAFAEMLDGKSDYDHMVETFREERTPVPPFPRRANTPD